MYLRFFFASACAWVSTVSGLYVSVLWCFRIYPSAAYKYGDGKKIDGKRVLVDVERGRTVKGWLPRKLGKYSIYAGREVDPDIKSRGRTQQGF